jgi:hypothetical protein
MRSTTWPELHCDALAKLAQLADRFPEISTVRHRRVSPTAGLHSKEGAQQAHTGEALRDGKQKSYLPSLLRLGSKLASSSCERLEMSAMMTTISLKKLRG